MKCDKCEKPATFHITELAGKKPKELHLCEEHARGYLSGSAEEPAADTNMASALAQQMLLKMEVGHTAAQLKELDKRSCPMCGITFYEFRSQGRLGCPNDYVCFETELEPLILNIHGETQHVGKVPLRMPHDSESQTRLIQLRREMQEAIDAENYEQAGKLRDEIRKIETSNQ